MNLSEKILLLRKQRGFQEALAEQLGVSRQAVSRWETGSALPDAGNLLQLSRLFGVTADSLLNDDCDPAPPSSAYPSSSSRKGKRRLAGICLAAMGLLGNFVLYLLSRAIAVMVPRISYDAAGKKWYHWSSEQTGHSLKYFIAEYDLELLVCLLCLLIAAGLVLFFWQPLKNGRTSCAGLSAPGRMHPRPPLHKHTAKTRQSRFTSRLCRVRFLSGQFLLPDDNPQACSY